MGWFGVDLFFVISGFVIVYSALLLRRADAPGFRRAYWARRLTRILPLYLLTLLLWLVVFRPSFLFQGWREWGFQLATHLTFTHSFWPETHGTIDGPNWSLAVEMHFYLAVAMLVGWIGRTPAWRLVLYAVAISWAWRFAMYFLHADLGAHWIHVKTTQLPGSLDLFAAGIAAAKWAADAGRPSARGFAGWSLAALATGAAAWWIYWSHASYWDVWWMVTFWRTALAISFGCLLMAMVHAPAALARALRPIDYLGEISYGLYLWHLFAVHVAVYAFGRNGPVVLAVALPATVALAALSWHWVEKPLMGLARRPAREASPPRPAAEALALSAR